MATATKPRGILTLPAAAYHDDPAEVPSLSASIASILCSQSPRHAWTQHPRLNPDFSREEKERYDVGTTAHALLLEGRAMEDVVEIIEADNWRTNAAKEARDEARAAGKIPLLAHVVEDVTAMFTAAGEQIAAINADPPLFAAGKAEQTLIWEEEGVICRALVDWLQDDFSAITDYKTAHTAKPERWTRGALFDNGYDVQAALYLRGLERITGVRAVWRWVIQEKTPPYALSWVSPGADVLALAEAKVDRALRLWKECLGRDEWPGYSTEVFIAEMPPWEEARFLEQEIREAA